MTKIISKSGLLPWQVSENLLVEAEILKKINHENIVVCLDVYQNCDHFHLVLEFCPGETLYDLIDKHSSISEITSHNIFAQA